MKLHAGIKQLAIPGPSTMPERVLRAMHRPAPNIYGGELLALTESLVSDLKTIAGCSGDLAIYIGNGHAVWEASICNVLSRGDKALGLVTGRFGFGWANTARALGVDVQSLDFGFQSIVDTDKLEAALREDAAHEIKVVMTVQTDTATSVCNDIAAIRSAIDRAGHPALLMVDCIASLACEPFDMDKLGVDVMVAASQKGLMTPPGVALVYVREKFWAAHNKAGLNSPYWDAAPRIKAAQFADYWCGTAPTHHLYGLREAVDMLFEEGLPAVWQRHEIMAQAVWAAVQVWSEGGQLKLNVSDESMRSRAVTTVQAGNGVAKRIRHWCQDTAGLTLGVGFSPGYDGPTLTEDAFRIGHMGQLNPPALLGVLATVDASLKSLGIAHGDGALDAATKIIGSHSTG